MKVLAAGGFIAVAAATVYFFGGQRPADVYPMPVSEAYAKLVHADFTVDDGYSSAKKSASGNGFNKVTWIHEGTMSRFDCVLGLAGLPEDRNQTKVTVTCDGGSASDGAAAGMVHNMLRNMMIERVDATLTGRPFDKYRSRGSTASRWPGDGVDGSLGTAIGGALKMEGDIRRMEADHRKDVESARFNSDAESSSDYSDSSDR